MEDTDKTQHSYSSLILTKASRYGMEKKSILTKQGGEKGAPHLEGWKQIPIAHPEEKKRNQLKNKAKALI